MPLELVSIETAWPDDGPMICDMAVAGFKYSALGGLATGVCATSAG